MSYLAESFLRTYDTIRYGSDLEARRAALVARRSSKGPFYPEAELAAVLAVSVPESSKSMQPEKMQPVNAAPQIQTAASASKTQQMPTGADKHADALDGAQDVLSDVSEEHPEVSASNSPSREISSDDESMCDCGHEEREDEEGGVEHDVQEEQAYTDICDRTCDNNACVDRECVEHEVDLGATTAQLPAHDMTDIHLARDICAEFERASSNARDFAAEQACDACCGDCVAETEPAECDSSHATCADTLMKASAPTHKARKAGVPAAALRLVLVTAVVATSVVVRLAVQHAHKQQIDDNEDECQ